MRRCFPLLLLLAVLGCGNSAPSPRNSVTVWEEGTLGYEVLSVPPRVEPAAPPERSSP